MEWTPVVSVLMTSYNRERYIGEAIESVLASTFTDFELIISDDRSTDRTVEIAQSYSKRDARVKVFVNEINLGDYKNRNAAAERAQGKYIKYVDADDYIYPWGLEILVNSMESYPEAAWGLCSLEQDEHRPFPFLLSPAEAYRYNYFGPGIFHKAPLSSIIRREEFSAIGGFSGKQHLGDFELWHLMALRYPVVLMPHGIVWHRVHDEQQSADNRVNPLVPFKYNTALLHFMQQENRIPLTASERESVISRTEKKIRSSMIRNAAKGKWRIVLAMRQMLQSQEFDFTRLP